MNKTLDSMWKIIVQHFAVKLTISILYSLSVSSFLSLSSFCSGCRGDCALYILKWKGGVSAHGSNIWLETARFSLPLFFEVKDVHESQYLQCCLRVCYGKHSLPLCLTLLLHPKRRVMTSGYQRLESAIYHMDMQNQAIAFKMQSLVTAQMWCMAD